MMNFFALFLNKCTIYQLVFSPFASDQCKASAYLPFDVDLEDKSGSNTAVMVRNVTMTPYGSAHFTGNSALTLYKYADMSLGNKLLISFKFKFDRWPDSLDHAGKIYSDPSVIFYSVNRSFRCSVVIFMFYSVSIS